MKIVVDSNIVYSTLLNTDSRTGKVLLHPSGKLQFFTAEYLKEEIDAHQSRIIELTGFSEVEFIKNRDFIYQHLYFFTEALIPFEIWREAANLVRAVDMNDIAFVALSLHTKYPIWTGDKRLISALERKGFSNFAFLEDLLVILDEDV